VGIAAKDIATRPQPAFFGRQALAVTGKAIRETKQCSFNRIVEPCAICLQIDGTAFTVTGQDGANIRINFRCRNQDAKLKSCPTTALAISS